VKLLMIIVEESRKEELEAYLAQSGVEGFTEISPAVGIGATGPRLGSRAFPRTSAVIFTLVADEALAELQTGIREFCADCHERLRMVAWGVESVA
jgi:hypothetical protein